jgi:hypothetical protein
MSPSLIWKPLRRSTGLFGVWHRRFTCGSGEWSRFLGDAATADEAKAIAQTDADHQHD